MATLNKKQKLFIVQSLAVFNTPQETVQLVKEEYNIEITRQQVESYDPTKRAGKDLSAEFVKEFETVRKDFLDKPLNIPTANKSVRLKILNDLVYKNHRNQRVVRGLLEQIAKEMGGLYTNKQEMDHTSKGESINKPTTIELVAPHVQGTDRTAT